MIPALTAADACAANTAFMQTNQNFDPFHIPMPVIAPGVTPEAAFNELDTNGDGRIKGEGPCAHRWTHPRVIVPSNMAHCGDVRHAVCPFACECVQSSVVSGSPRASFRSPGKRWQACLLSCLLAGRSAFLAPVSPSTLLFSVSLMLPYLVRRRRIGQSSACRSKCLRISMARSTRKCSTSTMRTQTVSSSKMSTTKLWSTSTDYRPMGSALLVLSLLRFALELVRCAASAGEGGSPEWWVGGLACDLPLILTIVEVSSVVKLRAGGS